MPDHFEAAVTVHAGRRTGPYRPIWNWFGYDEPNYTYGANGKALLARLADLSPVPPRVRTHNLLTSGDGTPALKWGSTNAYTEDAAGNPVYDWTILDRLFDTWVEAGVVPFVQVGFTPEALSSDPGPYRHHFTPSDPPASIVAGWAAPPKDLGKWAGLVSAFARHLAERYGAETVAGWPWEVWNEPDGLYWTGTVEEFCALYDATAAAIRAVLPQARIGGPHTCGAAGRPEAAPFLRAFLAHCVANDSPLDFVAFHAKGNPVLHRGRVRMGLARHLADIETGLDVLAEFPALAGRPVILGESDPEGCAACSARYVPRNRYRNGPLYGTYVVEAIARTWQLARRAGVEIEGAVTWAFLFEDQPTFDGFRSLATNGIDKPVLNAFRMLGMLGGSWLAAESSHALPLDAVMASGVRAAPDIGVLATRDEGGVSVLLWHYHDDDVPGPDAAVTLDVDGLPGDSMRVLHYRMDAGHSNAHAVWQAMGAPQDISPADHAGLAEAGKLTLVDEAERAAEAGAIRIKTVLPRQGVSLIRITA